LRALHKLSFIDLKSGPSGPESYALIWNPYLVIKCHHDSKTPGLREDKYNALVVRALEIGDKTFAPLAPVPVATPAPATAGGPVPHPAPAPPQSVQTPSTVSIRKKMRVPRPPLKPAARAAGGV
jgi:hypothetical protein